MNSQTKQSKGFTIIEVVLVLAIAALIFLMVFIALPALQANQRDTQRKQDASVVASAITGFTSGERTTLNGTPAHLTNLKTYIDDLGYYTEDDVVFAAPEEVPGEANADAVFVIPQAKCKGTTTESGNNREAAVVILLDNKENSYCVDAS